MQKMDVTVSECHDEGLTVGELRVEPAVDKISRNSSSTSLRPQVMELLVFLANHQGRVVSIEELLDQLWPGKVVTDGTLYNCVGELRHAIASLDDSQTYIENIPKKGYRLSVEVADSYHCPTANSGYTDSDPITPSGGGAGYGSLLSSALRPITFPESRQPQAVKNEGHSSDTVRFLITLVCGLLISAAAIYYMNRPNKVQSIAVLPFEDISPAGDQAYFGSGMADELRLGLQRLDGLRVAARTSSIAYKGKDSKTIGELLNVDSIVEGSIRKEGGNIRITAQLTQATDGFTIWSRSYNRKLENIFDLQEELATSVAGALGVRLGVGTVNAFRGAGTRNVEAYELYLQTQTYEWSKPVIDQKIQWLKQAVALDPTYAAAWSSLGNLILCTAWDVGPHEVTAIVDRAYPLVTRGVKLNPESATAHSNLAVALEARFDWIGAEQSHKRAMELMSDRLITEKYAWTLMRSGRTGSAQSQYEIAQSLEPLNGRPPVQAWHVKVALGRFAEATEISDWQTSHDIIENNIDIAFNKSSPEKLKEAIRAMPAESETNTAYVALYAPVLAVFDSPDKVLSIVRDVYEDDGVQWIRKRHDLAMIAAYFGDPQFALKAKSEEVSANVLRISSLWYPVMSDVRRLPEFKTLVSDLNLVDYWRTYGWADHCQPISKEDFVCS